MSNEWKLVPVDPTQEMREAINALLSAYDDGSDITPSFFMKMLISAAPPQPDHSAQAFSTEATNSGHGVVKYADLTDEINDLRAQLETAKYGLAERDSAAIKAREVLRLIIKSHAAGVHYAAAQAACHQINDALSTSTEPTKADGNPDGKRERFEKWVMATKHPVFGFLDGRSLARSDDRTGYADEYAQGLWVAYQEFGGFASREESIGWLKRIDGIGQNRAELIYSMGFRRLAD